MSLRAIFLGIVQNALVKKRLFLNIASIQPQCCHFIGRQLCSVPIESQEFAKKAKKTPIPKITLISNDESVSITTLAEAQKVSKRRDLKLVKIIDLDTKTQRPVYKLMTGAEYHKEDLKQRDNRKKEKDTSAIKGEKVVILSSNISVHDLEIHANKVVKWLAKRYEVRFIINGSSSNIEKTEQTYKYLEEKLKDHGRILQKRSKGNDLRFQMVPPKKEKESL